MRPRWRPVLLAVVLTITAAADAWAQNSNIPAKSLRGRLFDFGNRIGTWPGLPYDPGTSEQVETLAELTNLQVATTPLGTSTDAFTFTFDLTRGTFIRSTQSFGPSFAKRAVTSGRGTLGAGLNWLHSHYNALQGFDLRNGDLRIATNVQRIPQSPYGYASAALSVSADTGVASVSYGATDNLDLSLAVPWVRVAVDMDVGLFSAANVDVTPGGRTFVLPRVNDTGLGDIAVAAKYRFWHQDAGALATEVEVRLPSGNPNGLRGTGVTRTAAAVIYSRSGRMSPHGNVGFELWSAGVPLTRAGDVTVRNQIVYAFGLEIQGPRATVMFDLVGRRQLTGGRLEYRTVPRGAGSIDLLIPMAKGIDVISAAPGIKWNLAGNVLLKGHALFAMTNDGLRANVIPVVGFDWVF